MGKIPAKTNMISSIIIFPAPGDVLDPLTTFDFSVQTRGLSAGAFTNAQLTYYSAPQDLDQSGQIIGHTHVTCQDLGNSLTPNVPPNPETFVFFKGINDRGNGNGLLSATVTGGLPEGFYRCCTMTSAANHQPALMPVAQRGAQDDCTKFEVKAGGGAGTGGGGGGGNGGNGNTGGGNGGVDDDDEADTGTGPDDGGVVIEDPTSTSAAAPEATEEPADEGSDGGFDDSSTTAAAPAQTSPPAGGNGGSNTGGGRDGGRTRSRNRTRTRSSAAPAATSAAAPSQPGNIKVVDTATGSATAPIASPTVAAPPASTASPSSTAVPVSSGDLGGTAPPVLHSGKKDRPFCVEGNTFVNSGAAVQRACDIQFNRCANAVNGGRLRGKTVQDCEAQKAGCGK
jgi:hypothetical protein